MVAPRGHEGSRRLSALPALAYDLHHPTYFKVQNNGWSSKNLDFISESWKMAQERRAKRCSLQLNQFPLRDFQKVLHDTSYRSETSHMDTSKHMGDWGRRVFYLGALPFVRKWEFSY